MGLDEFVTDDSNDSSSKSSSSSDSSSQSTQEKDDSGKEYNGPEPLDPSELDIDTTPTRGNGLIHYLDKLEKPELEDEEHISMHGVDIYRRHDGSTEAVCSSCPRTASSFETIRKVDKLEKQQAT